MGVGFCVSDLYICFCALDLKRVISLTLYLYVCMLISVGLHTEFTKTHIYLSFY
ncbi:Tryptophan--tRNA ligase [Gossypium arboreum]|uniref:Tryptophan--tRNA ligase n=1 Tax=Gossypium arboreum TaxID=29729 RepID=A0A0B0P5F0_GOSAR|nr:Tryptophan--tRNA ligase [Gossypium arboreum]